VLLWQVVPSRDALLLSGLALDQPGRTLIAAPGLFYLVIVLVAL